jgi:hypothetical protein
VERRLYDDPNNLEAVARYAVETRARLTGLPSPPVPEGATPYDPSLVSSILWNYPAYAQNYLFAYLTEAWMHDAVRGVVGDPVGNAGVGPLLVDRIVRAPATTAFPDRIAAFQASERGQALRAYLALPAAAPTPVAVQAAEP